MEKINFGSSVTKKLSGKKLENLFWAYFNNKMTILLMMIEHPEIAKSALSCERQKLFLHDLWHHFLSSRAKMKYHHAFRWLERFFECYPDITFRHTYKAIKMIELIYEAFGHCLSPRLEAIRLEKEDSIKKHASP